MVENPDKVVRAPLTDFLVPVLGELSRILVDRSKDYKDFQDVSTVNQSIARSLFASVSFGGVPDSTLTAIENIRGKLARLSSSGWEHRDSWIDIAGYAILAVAVSDRNAATLIQERK